MPWSLPARIWRALSRRIAEFRAVRRASSSTDARLKTPARRLLVVCYGNIYRSPFVAAHLRNLLGGHVELRSAGFHPREGRESPAAHVEMSLEFGITLRDHRSRRVTGADLEWADLIVLMDRHNWTQLRTMRAAPEKLVWLGTLESSAVEIPDPYGLSPEEARQILLRLYRGSQRLADRINGATAS